MMGSQSADVQVIVDENRIQSISLVSLDETVATMYPAYGAGIGKCQ